MLSKDNDFATPAAILSATDSRCHIVPIADEGSSGDAAPSGSEAPKGESIVPYSNDVLMGRGKSNKDHPGNVRFQALICMNRDRYFRSKNPEEKKSIIVEIVRRVTENGGRILRRTSSKSNGWVSITGARAQLKVAHALQYRQRCSLAKEYQNEKGGIDENSDDTWWSPSMPKDKGELFLLPGLDHQTRTSPPAVTAHSTPHQFTANHQMHTSLPNHGPTSWKSRSSPFKNSCFVPIISPMRELVGSTSSFSGRDCPCTRCNCFCSAPDMPYAPPRVVSRRDLWLPHMEPDWHDNIPKGMFHRCAHSTKAGPTFFEPVTSSRCPTPTQPLSAEDVFENDLAVW